MSTKLNLVDFFNKHGDVQETGPSWSAFIKDQELKKYQVHVWKNGGNFFFEDIANYLEKVLSNIGMSKANNTSYDSSVLDIVVAPHEFMYHDQGRYWHPKRSSEAIYLNTEQWHTSWFMKTFYFIEKSRKVMDINPNSAFLLRKLGFNSAFFPIIELDPLSQDLEEFNFKDKKHLNLTNKNTYNNFEDREIDILYIATANTKRDKALASLAEKMSNYNTFIHAPKLGGRPITKDNSDAIDQKELRKLARCSKILLNIHREEAPYFEWHRLFLTGISNGCVVLTEPCLKNNILKAGTATGPLDPKASYIQEESISNALKDLLETSSGKKRMLKIHQQALKVSEDLRKTYWD